MCNWTHLLTTLTCKHPLILFSAKSSVAPRRLPYPVRLSKNRKSHRMPAQVLPVQINTLCVIGRRRGQPTCARRFWGTYNQRRVIVLHNPQGTAINGHSFYNVAFFTGVKHSLNAGKLLGADKGSWTHKNLLIGYRSELHLNCCRDRFSVGFNASRL